MEVRYAHVNQAFQDLIGLFYRRATDHAKLTDPDIGYRDSRVGHIYQLTEPLLIEYRMPYLRVLLNQPRDANPVFHLVETVWMLAGRNDVKPLTLFNRRMAEYSDDGCTLSGAYGHRMRRYPPLSIDQLRLAADELKRDPNTRRVVVAIWNPEIDLRGLASGSKDLPCNTHLYFMVEKNGRLRMTVCNRSNDLVWGALGANVVHFSYIHSVVASLSGYPQGSYYQFTNNAHVYSFILAGAKTWLDWYELPSTRQLLSDYVSSPRGPEPDGIALEEAGAFTDSLVGYQHLLDPDAWKSQWLAKVVAPAVNSFFCHRTGNVEGATRWMRRVKDFGWRNALALWLEKRHGRLPACFD